MTQRDTNRDVKREAIIDAGLARMLSGSVGLLRSVLNASSLSVDADISKDTTYRLFRGGNEGSSDAIVREVAAASTSPTWAGFDESVKQIASAFQDAIRQERSFEEALIEAMAADVETQFRSPGGPVGWIFHSVAMTASPAWQGERFLSPEDQKLGDHLLAIRADFYRKMTDDFSQLMTVAMSLVGRRPRRGMDPRQLIAIMHSMIDGAVLRRYVEPDVFDSIIIGEAVYALAMAFSEDGGINDPRRPSTPADEAKYEAMVNQAGTSWELDSGRTVQSTAHEAAVSVETGLGLFRTVADLADSVVWSRVLGGGPLVENDLIDHRDGHGPSGEMAMLFGTLRRLREVVEVLPGAIDIIRDTPPEVGPGIRTQLEREAAEVLRCECPGVDPRLTAAELVSAAFLGKEGWASLTSLMRVLDGCNR